MKYTDREIEYATNLRNITKEWIEERIKNNKNSFDCLTINLKNYYQEFDKIIEDVKIKPNEKI